jgi:putative transposase
MLKAKVHSAKVPDQDGLRLLLESARSGLSRISRLWLDAGYEGRGRRWAEEAMGVSVEVVRKPPRPLPEEVAKRWAREWAKEGKKIDWQGLMPQQGYLALPRRWVVERTFSWLGQNRRMSKDYERLCASAEAFVYAAMIRLMVGRLARG